RAGDHAPAPRRAVRRRVRGDGVWRSGQGRPRLVVSRAGATASSRGVHTGVCSMTTTFIDGVRETLDSARAAGTYKTERVITTPQRASIGVAARDGSVLNFCANNYLGLSDHP